LKEKHETMGVDTVFLVSVVVKVTSMETISFPWGLLEASKAVTRSREKTTMKIVKTMMISNRREGERMENGVEDVIWVREKRMEKERSLVSLETRNEESSRPFHPQRL